MKWLIVLGLVLASFGQAAAQETRIAAVVNDEIVSVGDVSARLALVMRSSGMPDTAENRQRLGSRILRTLIDEKLQMQEAKHLNVTVTQSDIDAAMGRLEERNNMPKGSLDDMLKRINVPRSTLVDQVTAALTWGQLVRNHLGQDVTVSEEETEDAMTRLKAEADKPESRVAEIFLALDNPSQEDEVHRLADRLIDQIRGGASFSTVALQFSQSPTAAVGGDIGWILPSQLSPLLAEAVEKMNPGEMSYPIRTAAGYYILYLLDRRTLGAPNGDDTILSLVEVLFALPATAASEERQRIEAEAQQISATVKNCGELNKIGRERAPQLSRQIPQVKARDLPADLRPQLLALKVGEASKPIFTPTGIAVLMVCDRQDPPGLPTRDQVMDNIARERLDALGRRYMRDLRRSAYVDIRG